MLLQNLRAKMSARLSGDREAGFTLIELLVVMLILGILAAIALPAFFNQKDKAGDAKAKETAHSAQVAMETCYTDNGSYATCRSLAVLAAIEPTLTGAPVTFPSDATDDSYEIQVANDSRATQLFRVRNVAGVLSFPCDVGGQGGCPDDATPGGVGDWGG